MSISEDTLKGLKSHVKLIKNKLIGPTVDLDLLIEETKVKEQSILELVMRVELWESLLQQALSLEQQDKENYFEEKRGF